MGVTKWLITKTHIDRTLDVATVPVAGIDTLSIFRFRCCFCYWVTLVSGSWYGFEVILGT